MDPTPTNIATFMTPTAVFTRNPPSEPEPLAHVEWCESSLNPKNRIDSLDPHPNCDWTIHGADLAGTRWFALPRFAEGKRPMRIDVHVPECKNLPTQPRPLDYYLRDALSPNSPMFGELEAAANCRTATYIARALHSWSGRNKETIEKQYFELPFGSRIVFETLLPDIHKINIQFVPIYDIERQWLSLNVLQDMWKLPDEAWPTVVEFDTLQFRRQLHDTVSVVTLLQYGGTREFIFKSLMNDLKYFYHELKVLLTMEPHPNIIPRPLHLVTKRGIFGGKRGICGMILQYYPKGTLRRWLKEGRRGTNDLSSQICWAKQITSALMHLQNRGPGFYTNLKLDNIVMADADADLTESSHLVNSTAPPKIVLIDFEQRLGSPAWTPPEIHSAIFLTDLIRHNPRSTLSHRYQDLFSQCSIPISLPTTTGKAIRYTNPSEGYAAPWSSKFLSPLERESAQVFMLGKLLWCMFENSSLLNSYIGINSFRDNHHCEGRLFPQFTAERTPEPLRELILRCTAGSWESRGTAPPLVAKGRMIVLRGAADGGNSRLEDVQTAIRKWWREQIADAEAFFERRAAGSDDGSCRRLRPRLGEVLAMLETLGL